MDRSPIDVIEPLSYLKLKFQINASSLCTFVKRPKLYEWILRDLVVALGSDINLLNKKAMKEFIKCSKKLKEDFGKIMQKSFAILNIEKYAHI